MKTEFVSGSHLYKEINKEDVIFYIEGHFIIFAISKKIQNQILSKTKYLSSIISEGMLFSAEGNDGYPEFLDAMHYYFNNSGLKQGDFDKCNYFVVKKIR